MNRKLLVAPLLVLGVVAGPAAAEYLLIRINLDKINLPDVSKLQQNQPGFGALGGFGMQGGPGMPGPGGIGPGGPGGVGPGMMPGFGMRGGGLGMRGGAGGYGMRGGPMPGGAGGQGLLGGQGASGPQAPRGTGPNRGKGGPVTPPQPGNPNNPQGQPQKEEEPEFDPASPYVSAFVEFKLNPKEISSAVIGGESSYGHTILPYHQTLKGDIHLIQIQLEPFLPKFTKDLKKYSLDKKIDKLLELAEWALAHGLTHKEGKESKDATGKVDLRSPFDIVIDEIAKISPKHWVVKNVERVREFLKKPLPDDDPEVKTLLEDLQRDGFRATSSTQGHFVIVSSLPPSRESEPTLRRRLHQMEEHLAHFYYWFALHRELPQPAFPRSRLGALLTNSTKDFYDRHTAYGAPPLADDGFTPRRDNIMILANKPLDDNYVQFAKQMEGLLTEVKANRDELLTGDVWKRSDLKTQQGQYDQTKAANFVYVQTLNLLQRALEDESERAAVTHEGTRQLLLASGMFPRHVQVPEWVLTGLACYFEVPVGAAYCGVGLPSWSNLVAFKHFHEEKLFEKAPEVLYNVLTDRYFHTAQHAMKEWQANKDSERLAHQAKHEAELARSTAWALVFYLAENKKLSHLVRYGREMQQLPRDLDLDTRALQNCFARAFDLSDAKDARRLDMTKLQKFADEWIAAMLSYNLEIPQLQEEYLGIRRLQDGKKEPVAEQKDKEN